MEDDRLRALLASSLWSNLPSPALAACAEAMDRRRYEPGQAITRQGEPVHRLHLLTSGSADIRVAGQAGAPVTVAAVRAGDVIGEMALFTDELASADVVAGTEVETLSLDRTAFHRLVGAEPEFLKAVIRLICRRLRTTDQDVQRASARADELELLIRERLDQYPVELLGREKVTKELRRRVDACAELSTPALIVGGRGTGKELVARRIHYAGPRAAGPLLRVDATKITADEAGDALCGGPLTAGMSYLSLAAGGTVVIKQIEALPALTQERLAAYLEAAALAAASNGRGPLPVRILGTSRCQPGRSDVAAALHPALGRVLAGQVIELPSLRERKRDIPELARQFLARHAARQGKQITDFADDAMTKLVSHDYAHGNVAELDEAIERAVSLTDSEVIESDQVFLGMPRTDADRPKGLNLLALPDRLVRAARSVYPHRLRLVGQVLFALAAVVCLVVPAGPVTRLGLVLCWSIGWPLLVLSFFLFGRAWCAVCPMGAAGALARRVSRRELRIPAWLKSRDIYLTTAGFLLIVWLEEATAMRTHPRATGLLLLGIAAGAVLTGLFFPRRTWCRHLCPLGGLASACATSAILELRPSFDICSAKCQGHDCYQGTDQAEGCPMFQHVMFLDTNHHCTLCLNCLEACPNHSPRLNLRLPGSELWYPTSATAERGLFVAVLLGLLPVLVLLQHWELQAVEPFHTLLERHRLLWTTGLLAAGAAWPTIALALLHRSRDASADRTGALHLARCWLPLAAAGFAAYQFGFLPGVAQVHLDLAAGAARPALSISLLALLRVLTMAAGLLPALIALWRQPAAPRTDQGPSRGRRWVPLVEALAYGVLLTALMLRPAWFAG